ncbi:MULTISPECIES: rhodanese-like domain-containing protein [Acidovorax]|jgi:rhodanese-related sulfurtransferase|uniref:Rhodanese-related sulfurtransferase n=1 Tax=Acidovorax soli TaxID=592050 RepID=A0A7X0PAU4_9BURK|nr:MULTISPECIES: rhodanese-like domain-containing protein [Acidovorax]EJE54178.1 Rhodanese-related sulfurtransferase [Acidovorax sp. CF316]MBB6558500.1 rhodanese-related sulfurtransferase [Acidovorax soli]MDZ7863841.1 rhodanese-like domain-containing protein [Acidovorax sp.]
MIEHIRPAQLAAWFATAPDGSRPVVLDVREPWELQTASVRADGFELVAIPMGQLTGRLAELDAARDAGTPIACLCHHGARSLRVAAFLEQQGFERLANISGGIDAWSHENDPAVPRY